MKNLRQILMENLRNQTATGHFNFPNFEEAQAIVDAAKSLNLPVILGVSEGERDYVGVNEAVAWVKAINEDLEKEVLAGNDKINKVRVFLNADHTYSFEKVKIAVEAGFDMVIYDDAGGDLEKNIEVATECRKFITDFNKKNKKDVLFEAELGYIGKSSQVFDKLPDGLQMTTPDIAKEFTDKVKPDLLAPAVGNVHGMLKGAEKDPDLNVKLVREIFDTTKVPMVLHGASGNGKEEIQNCIKNGVVIVHVSTELRVAFKDALEKAATGEELAAYKFMKPVRAAVQAKVEEKLKIFSFLD